MTRPRIEVVAAVLQRRDGSFLLAQRPEDKVYAGYWEFPGGKVEKGETAVAALARELHEELGIEVREAFPWITRDYDYEHASVRLRFYRITQWSGELHGRERQAFAWQRIHELTVSPLLPANDPVLRALALPVVYGITNAQAAGVDPFLQALERATRRGLRLVQVREKGLDDEALLELVSRVAAVAARCAATVILNAEPALAHKARVHGIHLTSARLMTAATRPDFELVGASCHDERELARAAALEVDFVVLGPVLDTPTHPAACTLGWQRFSELVADYPLPVYALGGMGLGNMHDAWRAGAHGVAAIRGAWNP